MIDLLILATFFLVVLLLLINLTAPIWMRWLAFLLTTTSEQETRFNIYPMV
jgi:hypothetical protein